MSDTVVVGVSVTNSNVILHAESVLVGVGGITEVAAMLNDEELVHESQSIVNVPETVSVGVG